VRAERHRAAATSPPPNAQIDELNSRPFQKLDGCRRSTFVSVDRPAMKAFPTRRYELASLQLAPPLWKELSAASRVSMGVLSHSRVQESHGGNTGSVRRSSA
jgi:hypothetical protein